jgi:YegS/Rv2252/BmrU family lipid kinase
MHKVKLIFNPASDRGRSGQKASDLQAIVEKLGGADWAGTEYPGHAIEIAHQAADAGYEKIVAMGGDGTAHEVVNGLMKVPAERRPMMGVVPIGSGNDFAYSSGIPLDDPQEAMRRVFQGTASPVDVGLITDGNGRSQYWDNSAGFLFDAAVNIQSRKIRRIYGFMMYLTATIKSIIENYATTHMKLTVDGESFEKGMLMFTVANGPREGGGFMVAPQAKNDDGVFHYLMVDPISRPMMFRLLPEVMAGKHEKYPFVKIRTCKKMEFTADRAVPIHLDGELWAPYEADVRKVTIEMIPGAIRLLR